MCHALIIEDSPLVGMHIADVAEEGGAKTADFAETEDGALAAAMRRKPEIILSDVKLSAGTGPAAVVAIQGLLGPVFVIFITATPEECHPCDPPAVIMRKPINREAFLHEFGRLVPGQEG